MVVQTTLTPSGPRNPSLYLFQVILFPKWVSSCKGVKEPRHSETISDEKWYIYRSTRPKWVYYQVPVILILFYEHNILVWAKWFWLVSLLKWVTTGCSDTLIIRACCSLETPAKKRKSLFRIRASECCPRSRVSGVRRWGLAPPHVREELRRNFLEYAALHPYP